MGISLSFAALSSAGTSRTDAGGSPASAYAPAWAGNERDVSNVKGASLGQCPLVSAHSRTSDDLSARARSADPRSGTIARGTLDSKRRRIARVPRRRPPRRARGGAARPRRPRAARAARGAPGTPRPRPGTRRRASSRARRRAACADASEPRLGEESKGGKMPTAGSAGPRRTSELSVASTSIRLISGRIDGARRVLEARRQASRRNRSRTRASKSGKKGRHPRGDRRPRVARADAAAVGPRRGALGAEDGGGDGPARRLEGPRRRGLGHQHALEERGLACAGTGALRRARSGGSVRASRAVRGTIVRA